MSARRQQEGRQKAPLARDEVPRADDVALADTLHEPTSGAALADTVASDSPSRRETRGARSGSEAQRATPPAASTGRRVTREDPGRYELDEELGRGGMGRVVLARDRHLGRDVAMKELLVQALQPDAAMSVGAVTRFLREARITGQLEHPSIVPVHELGQREDGTIYYTMQRIRGRSLARALREAATLAERLKLLGHFRDVCEAVAYAHSRGVVHRDLKPENVMVGEFGETLVVDWGLAKVKGESDPGASDIARRVDVLRGADASHTVDGHAIGTPAYMSPEQARGDLDAIDERSDVWGLGAMLFEILTGRPPYVGKSALEVLDKVVSEPAPRVRTIEERAPPELAAIADRALIHEPSSRYVGAKPIADEIAAFQDGGQVKAYQYGARERFVRFVRRHRAASTAVALVVVAVAVSTGLVGRAYRQSLGALRAAQESRAEAHAARAAATRRADDTALALADAWLERAEHALDTGDPAAAALYAASALVRAEAATEGASDRTRRTTERATDELARERVARARSLVLDAEAARRFVFARFVDGADHRAALSHDGRQLVVPSADGVSLHPTEGGAAREVTVSAPAAPPSQLVGFLGDDRAIARFDGPDGATAHAVISLLTGEREAMTFDGASALGVAPIRLALARANGEIELLHGDELGTSARSSSETPRGDGVHTARSSGDVPRGDDLGVDARSSGEVAGGDELVVAARAATPHLGGVRLAVSAEGRVAVGSESLARVDVMSAAGSALVVVASPRLPAPARALAWSPTGEQLAIGLADPSVLVLGDRGATTPTWLATPGAPTSLAFSGDELVVASDGRLTVLDVMRGVPVETLHVPSGEPMRVEATPTTLVALPAGSEARRPRAMVFTRAPATPRATTLESAALDLALAADGSLVLATARELLVASLGPRGLARPRPLGPMPEDVGFPARLAVGADGSALVSTARGALVFFTPAGRVDVVTAPSDARPPCPAPVVFAPGSPTGSATAFVGRADGTVARVRAGGMSGLSWLTPQRGAIRDLALSRDGQTLAVGSLDGTVRVWSLTSERLLHTISLTEPPTALALSPDDRRLAIGDRAGYVEVRSLASPSAPEVRYRAHASAIRSLAWSPDARSVLSTSTHGARVHAVHEEDATLERIVRVRGDAFRALFVDQGRQILLHDGVDVAVLPSAPARREPAATLLARAEDRAGVRLDGAHLTVR